MRHLLDEFLLPLRDQVFAVRLGRRGREGGGRLTGPPIRIRIARPPALHVPDLLGHTGLLVHSYHPAFSRQFPD